MGVLKQTDTVRAQSETELMDFARVLAYSKIPPDNRTAVVTSAGIVGVITADLISLDQNETEYHSKIILKEAGFTVPNGILLEGYQHMDIERVIFPFVLKVIRSKILHKSEAGGVIPGMRNVEEFENPLKLMNSRFPDHTFLAEEMVESKIEAIIGVSTSSEFGLVIILGIGEVLAELYIDVSFRVLEISVSDAKEMIRETSLKKFVSGFMGIKVDEHAILDAKIRLSTLASKEGNRIKSLDRNPLIINDEGAFVADAKIILE